MPCAPDSGGRANPPSSLPIAVREQRLPPAQTAQDFHRWTTRWVTISSHGGTGRRTLPVWLGLARPAAWATSQGLGSLYEITKAFRNNLLTTARRAANQR